MKKDTFRPQVGDTLYWKSYDGKIYQDTCYEVVENPQICDDGTKPETEYYVTPKGQLCRSFLLQEDLLNPNSRDVKNFLKREERKAWAEFWSKSQRVDEIVAWFEKHKNSKDLKKAFGQFIIKKLGI